MIILVDEEIDAGTRLAGRPIQVFQLFRTAGFLVHLFHRPFWQILPVRIAAVIEGRIAMFIQSIAVVAQVGVDDRKVQVDDEVLVVVGRRVLAYVQVAIKPLESVCTINVVIVMQHGHGKALAEAAGTDEEEELVGILHLLDEPRLVHIVAVILAHSHEIHHPIWDALCLYSYPFFFHNHDAFLMSDNKSKAIW